MNSNVNLKLRWSLPELGFKRIMSQGFIYMLMIIVESHQYVGSYVIRNI